MGHLAAVYSLGLIFEWDITHFRDSFLIFILIHLWVFIGLELQVCVHCFIGWLMPPMTSVSVSTSIGIVILLCSMS